LEVNTRRNKARNQKRIFNLFLTSHFSLITF